MKKWIWLLTLCFIFSSFVFVGNTKVALAETYISEVPAITTEENNLKEFGFTDDEIVNMEQEERLKFQSVRGKMISKQEEYYKVIYDELNQKNKWFLWTRLLHYSNRNKCT